MMALFGNLSFLEIALLAAASVMIFGRNLPRTAAQLYTHFVRARRALQSVWRDSGLGEEFRSVQREMEQAADTIRRQSPAALAQDAFRDVEGQVRAPLEEDEDASESETEPADGSTSAEATLPQDSEPAEPPQPKEKPPWYPENRADPFGVPRERDE